MGSQSARHVHQFDQSCVLHSSVTAKTTTTCYAQVSFAFLTSHHHHHQLSPHTHLELHHHHHHHRHHFSSDGSQSGKVLNSDCNKCNQNFNIRPAWVCMSIWLHISLVWSIFAESLQLSQASKNQTYGRVLTNLAKWNFWSFPGLQTP